MLPGVTGNAWFAIYHLYSTSTEYSPRAVRAFERDARVAAEQLDVDCVIVEDYYRNLVWGEFATPWNADTLAGFIDVAHDYGLKFLPYLNATELATTGVVYPRAGRAWGAKNRWGKVYCGFSSVMYPSVYFLPEYDFFLKLMCPASGWHEHLVGEATRLLDEFDVDGLYVDRLDYRVRCHDHHPDPTHFERGLVPLFRDLKNSVHAAGREGIVMNDSCLPPDAVMTELYGLADGILSELLLFDMNPAGIENQLATHWGDLVWKFKRLVRPFLTVLMPALYHSRVMVDERRIREIVGRIRRAAGPTKPLFLFSHRTDAESRAFLRRALDSRHTRLCFYAGPRPLATIEELEPDGTKNGRRRGRP